MNLVEGLFVQLSCWLTGMCLPHKADFRDNFDDAIPGGCVIGTWALDAARIHLHTERNWILWAGLFHQCPPLYATLGPRQNA
jgi:hypothetical protein